MLKFNFLLPSFAILCTFYLCCCKNEVEFIDLNNNGVLDIYENPQLSASMRSENLISYLTVDEKISQLQSNSPSIKRLGISDYNWMSEALHGIRGDRGEKTTVFPQAIGLAATWNTNLAWVHGNAISDEARGLANSISNIQYLNFWSPVINIARDPRWGRTQEGYGEDPELVSSISLAFINGLQGSDPNYFKVLAAPKHFVANNEEIRRHSGSSDVSEKLLRDYYFPAFKNSVIKGNVQSFMTAYNALNGVPCTANKMLIQEILREEWGFEGWVVSDCGAIYDIHINHKYENNPLKATSIALKAGVDLNCGSYYRLYLKKALKKGFINETDLDNALKRLFVSRFKLGMFDPIQKNPFSNINLDALNSEKNQNLALEIARQSIVLLKNENNFLPIQKTIKSIAVIGPNADICRFGTYSGEPLKKITPFEGIKTYAPDSKYAQGNTILEKELPTIPDSFFLNNTGESGVTAEYYKGQTINNSPDLIRNEKSPNIKWKMNGTPDSNIFRPNDFCTKITGSIVFKRSGQYQINVNGIDGIRFFWNDSLIIDKTSENYSHTTFITDHVLKGRANKFKIEYFEDEGWGEIRMGYALLTKNLREEAVNLAENSELVVFCGGTYDYIESEGRDRENIALPKDQIDLIKEIHKVNKNICLVLINGGPISLPWIDKNIDAIVEAWYPGQAGGKAIAEVLFGDYNPGGKLPLTFYNGNSQLSKFDDYDIRKGHTYMYLKNKPLFPFGYGLSYSEFEFSSYKLNSNIFNLDDTISISFNIKNNSEINGSEVPQIYIQRENIKRLKGFKKIFIKAKETKDVKIKIPIENLQLWNEDISRYEIQKGEYHIYLGNNSENLIWTDHFIVQ